MTKNVTARVFTPQGVPIRTWESFRFQGFKKETNAGLGECTIMLAEPFGYDGPDLLLGNVVEVRIADRDTVGSPDGSRVIYRGYISLVSREVDGAREYLEVTMLGFYTLLSLDILKDGTQTTLYSNDDDGLTDDDTAQDAADIGYMARTVVRLFGEENGTLRVFATATSCPDTNTEAEYTFEQKTYREALDKLRRMAPAGTFYYVNEDGVLFFGVKPETPTHTFILGKHFSSIRVERSLEKVRNGLLLWNGDISGIYKGYESEPSIEQYGRRVEVANDYGVAGADAADLIGAKFLEETAIPEVKVICTIMDNNIEEGKGYDIESIQPGDTCSFLGFDTDIGSIFRENMLISSVLYKLDTVRIEVEVVKSGLIDFQNKQRREINDIGSGGLSIPESYST
jgi:hypothetical protein